MKKKLLAVLMTGIMAASFAGTATSVYGHGTRTSTSNPCRWLVSSMQKIMMDLQ